jgi:hypothetical protein
LLVGVGAVGNSGCRGAWEKVIITQHLIDLLDGKRVLHRNTSIGQGLTEHAPNRTLDYPGAVERGHDDAHQWYTSDFPFVE